ncbi:MAG TPA: Gldg family protein, partial [Bacteroidales bacterium]|nr:Gldg family protein [Bacteroidales bacterium]
AFSERDKFILDQYIMRGGKVLWLLDRTTADMDSLQTRPETVGIAQELNLDDMLFRYGARINPDLLMDIRSMPIPVKTGEIGGQPQFEFYPWFFMPLVGPASGHPIVANLNMVKTEFVSSIDTIDLAGIRKLPLLQTSKYTRQVPTPAYVSLEILKEEPKDEMFQAGGRTVALLLEGQFPSLFANRIPPEIANNPEMGFLELSEPTGMIVVADGDVITNQVSAGTRQPLPLGYDQYTGETFGNRDFLLNAVNYLCDGSGLIDIRAREIKMRLLDRTRANSERLQWQLINTLLPVVLVLLFGIGGAWWRRRRYARVPRQSSRS